MGQRSERRRALLDGLDRPRGWPVILDTLDTHGRYFVLTLIDFYSNTFLYIRDRKTGTAAKRYLLVGPGWKGEAATNAMLVRSPTNDVYMNLRVKTEGGLDQAVANAIQDGFIITPTEPAQRASMARIRPVGGDPKNYGDVANQMLQLDPPPNYRQSLIASYRKVGICGRECKWDAPSDEMQADWRSVYPRLGKFMTDFVAVGATHGWIAYNPPG